MKQNPHARAFKIRNITTRKVRTGSALSRMHALEPKILFDAAIVDAIAQDPAINLDANHDFNQAISEEAQSPLLVNSSDDAGVSYVFIDSEIYDSEGLGQDILTNHPSAIVVVIGADEDGLSVISQTLAGEESAVSSIHILSHGQGGGFSLGSATLNQDNISGEYATVLGSWQSELSANADILLYGCNIADNRAFIEQIAEITQADIAASDDLTGHESLGADWELEVEVGNIESTIIVSEEMQQRWVSNLQKVVFNDEGGIDDEASQSDITLVSFDNTETGKLGVTVQFDETDFSGGNTSDVAVLFDSDGDGKADYAFMVTVGDDGGGNPELQGFTLYQGSDKNFNNLTNPVAIKGDGSGGRQGPEVPLVSTASINALGFDPFNQDVSDTEVIINIDLSEMEGSPVLLNVVTFPSNNPNSNPKDVLFDSAPPSSAVNDTASTTENISVVIPVLANDNLLAANTLEVADGTNGLSAPSNGSVFVNTVTGEITYVPNAGFSGTDSFEYTSFGTDLEARTATVTVTVANDPSANANLTPPHS